MTTPATYRATWDFPELPRACQLCDHRRLGGAECSHPEAVSRGRTMPVTVARALGGFCGPDARHLTFPGLRAPLTPSELTR